MADTIRDKIIQNVETTLKTVTTGNGYSQTVEHVYSPPDPNPNGKYVYQIRDMGDSVLHKPAQLCYENTMRLEVECIAIETDDEERRSKSERLAGDAIKSLMVDETRNSNAISTQATIQLNADDEPRMYQRVEVEILYRVKNSDPYTVRSI